MLHVLFCFVVLVTQGHNSIHTDQCILKGNDTCKRHTYKSTRGLKVFLENMPSKNIYPIAVSLYDKCALCVLSTYLEQVFIQAE